MLKPRMYHCSCVIQSNDGSTQSIIIIGGKTDQECYSKTTEILDMKNFKWVQGPELPLEIYRASSVALPPTSKYVCVLIGGCTEKE